MRKNSRENDNLVAFPSDEFAPVGTVLDPLPEEEAGAPVGDAVGEVALQRLIGGVWTLHALGSAKA